MLELNKIYNMDCLDGMKLINDESIDLVVADPPYFQIRCDFDFIDDYNTYLNKYNLWMNEIYRILKPNGSLYIFSAGDHDTLVDILTIHKNSKLNSINKIIWNYTTQVNGNQGHMALNWDMIHFMIKGDYSRKHCCTHSHIWNSKNTTIRMKHASNDKRNSPLGKFLTNVWNDCPPVRGNYKERVNHPTQKPIKLITRIIRLSSNENDLILDPFMGSGTTAVVCKNENRNYIGFELNNTYCELSNKRIEEHSNKLII